MEPTIRTSTGRSFHLLQLWRQEPNLAEIAHALSHLCRFTGHTRVFYSVAQHSVRVSHLVPPALALHGLLHDAAEAYLGDVSSPLKALLPEYQGIEAQVQAWLCRFYGLAQDTPPEVKAADRQALAEEMSDLFVWDNPPPTVREPIEPWEPRRAREEFLNRWAQIVSMPSRRSAAL